MGYFDPEPKRRREDFFNMEEELEELKRGLELSKLVVVTGLRRYGKTSLILTALNELKADYVFMDCRLLPPGMLSISDIAFLLERELSQKSWFRVVAESIEGIEVGALGIRFRRRDFNTLVNVLERLEGKVLVLDEAQELRRCRYRFDALIAYLYDHIPVRIVVSGSHVGTLYRFLRVDDPSAPLYGRPFYKVELKPLSRERAREFLVKGFEQEGDKPSGKLIEEALDLFDGVIGWLTYFGYAYTKLKIRELGTVLDMAAKLAYQELNHALQVTGVGKPRYAAILKILAERGAASWSEIQRFIEAKLGKIPKNTLNHVLKNLIDMGMIKKTAEGYMIADPVLAHAVKEYL